VDVGAFFVTKSQPTILKQPTEDPFDNAAMYAQATSMFRISLGDERPNAALSQRNADFLLGVVSAIGIGGVGTFAASSAGTFDRGNRVDQRNGLLRVVDVRAGMRDRQRRPLAIAHNMPLRAIFTAIRGIGSGLRPPKTARTEQLSNATCDQSISSTKPSSSSNTRQIFSHTPAACQSRSRRQQVMPEPHPNSFGRYSHGQPVRRMNRMPMRTWRFGTRGRPPLGLGGSGGNKGSINSHNDSDSSGLAMCMFLLEHPQDNSTAKSLQ
jgi:hypothetical protein